MAMDCDFIIRDAIIYDGSGARPVVGDVAVNGGRIVAVGDVSHCDSSSEIDARFHALCPGFIDTGSHDDAAVLSNPAMTGKLSQGVTTVVCGNGGISIAPYKSASPVPQPLDVVSPDDSAFFDSFAAYFDALERAAPAVNVVTQVGHSVLRLMHMADLDRPANDAEIEQMAQTLRRAMLHGAAGLSTGLGAGLSRAANADEVVRLAEVVHEFGGFYTAHLRDEGAHLLDALEEAARIGRYARIPVIIGHFRLAGQGSQGRAREMLQKIEELARGQALALDVSPYASAAAQLSPAHAAEPSSVRLAWSLPHPQLVGATLADLATEWGLSPEQAVQRLAPAEIWNFDYDEQDVRQLLNYSRSMVGSAAPPFQNNPHPAFHGSFARVLGHYALDQGLFPLPEAIRKMTSLPAATFGITDRGRIVEGFHADLVLFKPEHISDMATFHDPRALAVGINAVWVNGVLGWRSGSPSSMRAGRAIRRQEMTALRQEPWSVVYEDEAIPFSLAQ